MAKKLTFKEFEERSNKIHNGKYTYHEDTYISTKKDTTITCPIHGDFPQTPKRHMIGQGCPECGKEYARTYRKHNYQPFLDEVHKRFGDKFSFPLIEQQYVNNKTYITVKCNKCDYEFPRRPNDLLSDKFNGCKNCKHIEVLERRKKKIEEKKLNKLKNAKSDKEIFEKSFKKKFGEKLQPFMNEFITLYKEIHFKCNVCGYVFKRKPYNCLRSCGCPKCRNSNNQKLTLEQFTERANQIHNFKYDYSESEYIDTDTRLKVICHEKDEFGDEHGEFWVTPHSHIGMMKSGCPKCSGKFRKDTEYFIKQAKRVHGDKYDYSNTHYVKALKDIEVICKEHGSFWLTPNEHLMGQGCPLCKESHLEKEMRVFLDEKGINYTPQARFDWLRTNDTKKKMSLDYYIKDLNVAIECQGVQHFNAKRFWNNNKDKEEEVKKIKKRDKLKKKLCEEHGIKVLYYSNLGIKYPYEVFEDKEKLLEEILKSEDFSISLQKTENA